MHAELSGIGAKASCRRISFAWLEITGRCNLQCLHCYAESGPSGGHGIMTPRDWRNVISQARELGASVVQFIGGEPTLHPALPSLIRHAAEAGLGVEVYSNLTWVSEALWELFSTLGVQLATSYYSDVSIEHDGVTGRRGSHARTLANIRQAARRGIPLRAGIIAVKDGQRVEQARAELHAAGVTSVNVDYLRQVGRGSATGAPDVSQLCGQCGSGSIAVAADGTVWPCVFSRWMPVGSVRTASLPDIVNGSAMDAALGTLAGAFDPMQPCVPRMCDPQCGPSCSPSCNPQRCQPTCRPQYEAAPCSPSRDCQPNKCRPTR